MSGPPHPRPETREQLEQCSVPELRELAADLGIKGRWRMRKAQLVAALEPLVVAPEPEQSDITIVLTPLEAKPDEPETADVDQPDEEGDPPHIVVPYRDDRAVDDVATTESQIAPESTAHQPPTGDSEPDADTPQVGEPAAAFETESAGEPPVLDTEPEPERAPAGELAPAVETEPEPEGAPAEEFAPAVETAAAMEAVPAAHGLPDAPTLPDAGEVAPGGPKARIERGRVSSVSRRVMAQTVTIGSLYERDGTGTPMMGKATFALVVLYLVLNRLISDRMVLPVGISLRLYEVVLILVGLAWFLWMLEEPLPLPFGAPAITGLVLVLLVGVAPFIHGPGLNAYQANGAERGLFRMFMFVALFLAAYHIAFRRKPGLVLLAIIVASTVGQALFALYEFVTERPVLLLDNIALAIGLIPDPLSIRSDGTDVFQRLTGEIRAVATAPHPIILSGVIAVAALIVFMWIINVQSKRARRWLAVAGMILLLSLPVANSRTGFVIIVALVLPLLLLATPRLPSLIQWSIPVIFAMLIAFAVSPETPRLLLNSFTDPGSDPNTQIRVERFERLPELTAERPFLGAGYLTHDPAIQIFDNGYNLALVELGILGLVAFLAFVGTSLIRCWTGALRARSEEIILPIAGVIAALALIAGGATFDAWTFDQFFPTCICLLGLGLGRSAVVLRRNSTEEIVVHRPELVDA